ncbi:MAG: amidase [Rhodospirillaceae bacterium]|nr:amidase [Rhodospirillaceae bacterium]|tara:strand:- start:8588 stop:10027 length:1440 start_codon:yes stop_codon:yes gene_type:complete
MNGETDLSKLSALDLVEGYRTKDFSPVEVTEAVLARLEEIDGNLNAFCYRDDDAVRSMASESEARWMKDEPQGPVDGVPTSVKDVLRIKGWPTRLGSKTVDAKKMGEVDAPSVKRMRESGAVFIGMTTTPEMGWKGVTDSPVYGVSRNPWNMRMTPGGSSGGAAAAVACGVGPLAFGTDGGGSVRIPAGFTGIVALKPTFGRVAAWPPGLFGTLSHIGPMTRTVRDTALMMDVIGKPDSRDPWSLADDGVNFVDSAEGGIKGMKIAYSPDLGYVRVDPEIAALVDKAVEGLESLGAEVERIEFDVPKPEEAFRTIWYAAAAVSIRTESKTRRRFLDYGLAQIAEEGAKISAMDLIEAERARGVYCGQIGALFDRFDLLVTPTLPIPAFEAGLEVPQDWPYERWYTWTPFTYPFNLTRQPALTVPCGFNSDGLPAGLQIIGPTQADAHVMRAGTAYQDAFSTLDRWPTAGRSAPVIEAVS